MTSRDGGPSAARSRAVVAFLSALVLGGCLGGPQPPPTAAPATSAPATPPPSAPRTDLVLALESEPTLFSPAATDRATARVNSLIYNALYRLDGRLLPVPDLAAALPAASPDGRTWTVELRPDVRFHDGTALTARDVAWTYQLALSPNCPFGAVCESVAADLATVAAKDDRTVVFGFRGPSAPFLALVLARLAIVPAAAAEASLARLLDGARAVSAAEATELTDRISASTNADSCLTGEPPPSCELASFRPELEGLSRKAGLALPDPSLLPSAEGRPREAAYDEALLRRARLLAAALAATGPDRAAAAFPLLDLQARPVGTGPYIFRAYEPRARVRLMRNERYFRGTVGPSGVRAEILTDPAIAATALRTGEIDWLPEVSPDEVASLRAGPGVRVGTRYASEQRAIVFNVRPGRLYADAATRQAFALCIDKAAATREATGGRALAAWSPFAPASWAFVDARPEAGRDPAAAARLLDAAGWRRGQDGVRAREGRRLSSSVYVRPSRPDQVRFARAASEQLRDCGIELEVRELGFSADVLLSQLEYPNEFETLLVSRSVGLDPDEDVAVFHSRRVTTEQNPGDANFGGWADEEADRLIDTGRRELEPARRRDAYIELQRLLARESPAYPLWYEPVYAGLSARVTAGGEPVDLEGALPGWDIDRWQLTPP